MLRPGPLGSGKPGMFLILPGEMVKCNKDVYLNAEVKGKLVSSLLPQSEGKRKEAVLAGHRRTLKGVERVG